MQEGSINQQDRDGGRDKEAKANTFFVIRALPACNFGGQFVCVR